MYRQAHTISEIHLRRKNVSNKKNKEHPQKLSDLKWLPAALSCAGAIAFSQYLSFRTSNILTLLFAMLMYPVFKKRYSEGNGFCGASLVCGIIFGLFTGMSAFFITEPMFERAPSTAMMFPIIIMLIFFFEALTYVLYKMSDGLQFAESRKEPPMKKKVLVFAGTMLILLICWLPAFLYLYPCSMTEDSLWQLQQAAGQTELTNHHPILHTMIIRLIYNTGKAIFGNDTQAVLLYSIVQQLFMSACFAFLIETLYKFRARRAVLICALLCYIVPIFHSMYSVTMWKDVPFGGIMCVLAVLLLRILKKEKEEKISAAELVMLFVFSVGMCLMRSNGLYAFCFLLLFAAFVFLRRHRAVFAVMCAALISAFIIKGPVYSAMNVKPVDTIESLSMPAQQIAAVVSDNCALTDEQRELLGQVVDIDKIPEYYRHYISDPMKELVRDKDNQQYITDHKGEFLKLYVDLGLSHPDVYITAFINQTFGYWYPDVQYWVTSPILLSDGFDIVKEPKLGIFNDFFGFFQSSYIETPFLGLLWSIGTAVWVFIFMFGALLRRQKKSLALVFIPVLGIYLTLLIATPVYAEFRYIYSLFTTLPLFCTIPFMDAPEIKEEKAEAAAPEEKPAEDNADDSPVPETAAAE